MRCLILALLGFSIVTLGLCRPAAAQSCPAHSEPYETTVEADVITVHCQCLAGYAMSGGSCPQAPATPLPAACKAAEARVKADREIVAKQREQELVSAEDLKGWTELGYEGRKDLVKASIVLVVGMYAADADQVEEHINELQEAVDAAPALAKSPAAAAELAAINQTRAKLASLQLPYLMKQTGAYWLEQNSAVELGKKAVNDGFRAAAGADEQLAAQLQDPQLREALLGPEVETTERDHVLSVLNETIGAVLDTVPKFKSLAQATGPWTRGAAFVFDAGLADAQIWLSANRAAQGDDNAGTLAAAAGVIQAKFKRDVDALKACGN